MVDNFARRGYDLEMGVDSLVPIVSLQQRVRRWQEVSGLTIDLFVGDLTDAGFVSDDPGVVSSPMQSCTSPSSARRPTR